MTTLFPLGIKVGLGLNEVGDPMVSLGMVLTEDIEPVEYVFSEPGIATALASIQEGLLRAIVSGR